MCAVFRRMYALSHRLLRMLVPAMHLVVFKAALKLAEKQGFPSIGTIGPSWRTALTDEFSKPYFMKVGGGQIIPRGTTQRNIIDPVI